MHCHGCMEVLLRMSTRASFSYLVFIPCSLARALILCAAPTSTNFRNNQRPISASVITNLRYRQLDSEYGYAAAPAAFADTTIEDAQELDEDLEPPDTDEVVVIGEEKGLQVGALQCGIRCHCVWDLPFRIKMLLLFARIYGFFLVCGCAICMYLLNICVRVFSAVLCPVRRWSLSVQ